MKTFKNLLTALLLMCTAVATAHDFEVDGIYYNILSEEERTVEVTFKGTSYSAYSDEYTGSVVIPASVAYNGNTYSVTSIGQSAFYDCYKLTSVEIPNSVTSIGQSAFYDCYKLTSVEIPNSVTSIGNSAFSGCFGLTSIVVADGNKVYDSRNNCNAIIETATNTLVSGCQNTIIPNSVTSIGRGAFFGCFGLTSIDIPNSVTSIGSSAFSLCTDLTSIVIPNSVTSIGEDTFLCCSSLTSVVIPNSVTSIGRGAFFGCFGLTSVVIGNSVTSIGDYTFQYCDGLTSIEIPNSVTSIGVYAFQFCDGLTSIEIPNSVTSIGSSAFSGCTGLTSIVIPNSVTSIGNSAFSECEGLTSITSLIPVDKLFAIYANAFYYVNKSTCTLYVPYGAKEKYASTAGWSQFANIVELEPTATEVTVSINQYGCATYCSPYALDFSNVDGLKAYAATGYNKVTQIVTLTRLQTSQEGTGLFLKAEPGEYIVPIIECSNDYTLNLLVGTLEQTTVNSTDGAMSNYKFTILPGDEVPMFYPFEDNTPFSAGKAYLQIPTAWLPVSAQKSLNIRFDDGETTDIDEVKAENAKTIYDLQGRVVENPTSGIYIIDGKKVIIK